MKKNFTILTGATGDIGYNILKDLLKNKDYYVIATYKDKKKVNKLKRLKRVIPYLLDLSSDDEIEKFTKFINENYKNIKNLINNAGVLIEKDFQKIDQKEWDYVMQVNLKSPFFLIKNLFKNFTYEANIINISSIGGQIGGTKSIHYATSKAGLTSLTKSFSKLLAKKKIRVISISPGFIDTKMHYNKNKNQITKHIPSKKFGSTKDISNLVTFLLSGKSKYINGTNINIDGGYINII